MKPLHVIWLLLPIIAAFAPPFAASALPNATPEQQHYRRTAQILWNLQSQNRTVLQLTPEEDTDLRAIAAQYSPASFNAQTMAAMDARVALYMGYGEEIFINLPQFPQVIAESISQLQLQFKNQPDTHVCSIVPNPAANTVLVNYSLPDNEPAIFTVYDVSGKTIYKQMLQESGSFSIDISQWVSGMYYCRLLGSQQTNISCKLIVTNK